MYGIYAYIDPSNHSNVGIYGSPMEHLGHTWRSTNFFLWGSLQKDKHDQHDQPLLLTDVSPVEHPKRSWYLPFGDARGWVIHIGLGCHC